MGPLSLLGVAAEAEGLRLRRSCGLAARRAGWLGGAAVFGVAALALLHIAAIELLVPRFGLAGACGLMALADLLLATVLVVVARQLRDPVAEEALLLRRASLAAATSGKALMSGASGVAPVVGAIAGTALAEWMRRR
ncbi:hypothetical protein GWK16_19935 [Roseomonas sp. JC162]|uniref:Uncharacterized protein n=1 Tax=Neoroseomonas marina TaxID=1232220 RepID=A0A848EJF7_9PROT|nr:hypothetical protein [Neoroseomonas marina]NMJ43527.1 hypothetical protein [Neoroseomonas marina]